MSMLNAKQVPTDIGWYLAGFADGEGSFNVSQQDTVILSLFKRHLQCGTMRQRQDGVWYYEVNHLTPILENVIPLFDHFHFLSAKKKRDFAKFKQIAKIIRSGRHGSKEG